jgi:hypothetical protein
MMDMIVSIVEWILEFIFDCFAKVAQLIASVIFNTMDQFMSADDNVVVSVLSPVYKFGANYLKPFSLALMGTLVVYALLVTMFGKYSATNDDPIRLVVRACIFGALIIFSFPSAAVSSGIVDIIGGTAYTTDGKSESGIVLEMTSLMSKIGTSEDSKTQKGGKNGLNTLDKKTITSEAKSCLANGHTATENFTGFTASSNSDSETAEYTVSEKSDVKKTGLAEAISSNVSTDKGGFAIFLLNSGVYLIVYAILVLIMAWKCLKICSRFVYRFVIFLVMLYMAPVCFACGPAKGTQRIFGEWLKMIVSYAILLIATSAFMRVATEVIYMAFHYAGDSDLIKTVFAFLAATMFLKMIYDLEKYIEKLGLSAVGLPDSVSGLSREVGGFVGSLKHSMMREGTKSALDSIKGASSNPDFKTKEVSQIPNSSDRKAFEQGVTKVNKDGELVNPVANQMLKKTDNDNAFVTDATGEYMRASDGQIHSEDEFERNEDGSFKTENVDGKEMMHLKDNPSVTADSQTERFSYADDTIDTSGVSGLDSESSPFTSIEEAPRGTSISVAEDGNGSMYMAKTEDGSAVAIRESDLDSSNTTAYSVKPDGRGGVKVSEWTSSNDGDMYRVGKNGNLVNIGDGTTYNFAKSTDANAKSVKYQTTQSIGSGMVLNAKSGERVEHMAKFNTNLPAGARIAAVDRLEYCSTLYNNKDGTTTGIARQHIVDSKTGKPTGETKYVKFTRYDNNEISKDEIAKHRSMTNRNKSDRNNCEGYTPDGKHYIHIEKYMGDRKKPTIQKFRA